MKRRSKTNGGLSHKHGEGTPMVYTVGASAVCFRRLWVYLQESMVQHSDSEESARYSALS